MHVAAVAAFLILALTVCSNAASTPTEDLRVSLDAIISLLADKKMDPVKRRADVVQKIKADFDFESMSRFILGPNWNTSTPEQKKRFVELYTGILQNTYIERIEAYTDEKVKYISEKVKGDKAAVETAIVSSGKEIPVEYKLWLDKGDWRVYDVTIEGVSLVRNFQDSYKGVIRKDGIDGLIAQMEVKLREMEKPK